MYMEILSLTRCCFCAPLRYGLIVWAYLKLIFNMFVLGSGLIRLSAYGMFWFLSEHATYILIPLISMLLVFLSDIIFSFVLIVGIHKKHTTLLHLYLRFGIAHAVFIVVVGLTTIALALFTSNQIYLDKTLGYIVISLPIFSAFIILQTYLLLLIRSEMLNMKTNGQFQFTNHSSDPKCIMQADFKSIDKEKDILT